MQEEGNGGHWECKRPQEGCWKNDLRRTTTQAFLGVITIRHPLRCLILSMVRDSIIIYITLSHFDSIKLRILKITLTRFRFWHTLHGWGRSLHPQPHPEPHFPILIHIHRTTNTVGGHILIVKHNWGKEIPIIVDVGMHRGLWLSFSNWWILPTAELLRFRLMTEPIHLLARQWAETWLATASSTSPLRLLSKLSVTPKSVNQRAQCTSTNL